MKSIVIYKGKYGATARYAEWLGNTLQIPVVDAENIARENLGAFDCVVMGSSVYIGKLQLKSWIKENQSYLEEKALYLFIVCGTPPDQKAVLQKIVNDNVPPEIRERCKIYFLPGRVIRKNISAIDRLLLRMGAFVTRDPLEKQRMLHDFDKVNIQALYPMIQDLRLGDIREPADLTAVRSAK